MLALDCLQIKVFFISNNVRWADQQAPSNNASEDDKAKVQAQLTFQKNDIENLAGAQRSAAQR
jgi:hypothetical protein